MANKEKNENEKNSKLEQIVNEVIIKRRNEKKKYGQKFTTIEIPANTLYRHSYQVGFQLFFYLLFINIINTNCNKFQESQNRPISGSDFCYDIPLKASYPLKTISGSQETFKEDDDNQFPDDQNEE